MNESQSQEVLTFLKEHVGFFEAYAVHTFTGYRKKGDGYQEVTVEILDAGTGQNRYHVKAKSDDNCTASGNPFDRLDVVLATAHWQDLDA